MSEDESVAFQILVEDKPGVLFRVLNHFRRLNLNIDAVSVSSLPGVVGKSGITVNLKANSEECSMVQRMLNKSIDVVNVKLVRLSEAIRRELVLAQIKMDQNTGFERLIKNYGARVVSIRGDTAVVELTGEPETINSFINSVLDSGLVSLSRTGLAVLSFEEKVKEFAENIL